MLKTSEVNNWYVLYVRSSHERKVDKQLKAKEIESFLPMVKTIRQWSDRKKVLMKPLFPSYVFVKINSKGDFNNALSVPGACTYIRFGKEYAKVKEEEIANIKMCIESEDLYDIETKSVEQLVNIGERKKINYGALNGLECEVLKINENNKVVVRLESLQQNIVATIPEYYFCENSRVS